MQKIQVPNSQLLVSRLSFGTASLHHIFSSKDRLSLLSAAADADFSHFDTSPYYGYGIAEKDLGRLVRLGYSAITIASKIGIYPPRLALPNSTGVWLSKGIGKVIPCLSRPVINWSIELANKSLETTLRRLSRSYIDILFLHEPEDELLKYDEFLTWLYRKKQEGKLRYWGLAGKLSSFMTLVAGSNDIAEILQIKDSINNLESKDLLKLKREVQFTYGYLSDQKNQNNISIQQIIKSALSANSTGSIIVSTRKKSRLAELALISE